MNTYEARGLTDIPAGYQREAVEFAENAIAQGLMISIQLQDFMYDEATILDVYGMYCLTEEEVCDYYNSGGMWEYRYPHIFLNK